MKRLRLHQVEWQAICGDPTGQGCTGLPPSVTADTKRGLLHVHRNAAVASPAGEVVLPLLVREWLAFLLRPVGKCHGRLHVRTGHPVRAHMLGGRGVGGGTE